MSEAPPPLSKSEQLCASPRLFDNPILDKLSRVPWYMPLFYLPVAAYLFWLGLATLSWWASLGLAIVGYFIWTLAEYVFHRWVFHWEMPGKFGNRLHFLLHGVHHIHPNDPLRLVMPLLMSVPLMLLAWFVISLVFGQPYAYPVTAGFLVGYVVYDEIHFHIHHRTPRTNLELTLRRLHLLHHFRDPSRGYGVAHPFWDYVFGTAYTKADKPGEKAL